MTEIWDLIKSGIKYFGPVIIGLGNLLIIFGVYRALNRTKKAVYLIFSNPLLMILYVATTILAIALFATKVMPLL